MTLATSACLVALIAAAPSTHSAPRTTDFWFEWNRAIYTEWLWALKPGTTIPWLTAEGETTFLHEWRGRHVSVLTLRDDYDPGVMQRLVDHLDAFWTACTRLCGNTPPADPDKGTAVGGRPMIVEFLPAAPRRDELDAGGASDASLALLDPMHASRTARARAIGQIGVARTSITSPALADILSALASGHVQTSAPPTHPTPLGRELPLAVARNFFFFDAEFAPLAPRGELASAFASLLAADASTLLGWSAPGDERPIDATLDRFERDPSATFATVFLPDAPAAEPTWPLEELWLAILVRLQSASGRPDFTSRLWQAASECPPASTPDEAAANLIVAASGASGADLTARFRAWRFAIDAATKARVKEAVEKRRGP